MSTNYTKTAAPTVGGDNFNAMDTDDLVEFVYEERRGWEIADKVLETRVEEEADVQHSEEGDSILVQWRDCWIEGVPRADDDPECPSGVDTGNTGHDNSYASLCQGVWSALRELAYDNCPDYEVPEADREPDIADER